MASVPLEAGILTKVRAGSSSDFKAALRIRIGTSTRLIRYAGGSEDTPGGVISDPATSPGLDDVSEPWASGTEAFIPSW